MKLTKQQMRKIINEVKNEILREESSAAVENVISSIEPNIRDMSKAELDLLSMQIDNLISKLGGSVNESARNVLGRVSRILREEYGCP